MRTLCCMALALGLLAADRGSAMAGNAVGVAAPYEDLLEVLGPLAWHLDDDLYRFAPPRDPTGRDLFQLSLARLDGWQTRFPSALRDVVTFARGQVLERVGEYRRAADAYQAVAASDDPALATAAKDHAVRARTFADAAALPESGSDLDRRLAALRRKLDAWGKIVERSTDVPHRTIALAEEERLEQLTSSLVVANRHLLDRGSETAERALRFMIQKHAESKRLPEHVLRLGDLYGDLAREYAIAHERPLAFEEAEFVARADRALDVYQKVASWDGIREKPEGQARFAALEAYKANVLGRYR